MYGVVRKCRRLKKPRFIPYETLPVSYLWNTSPLLCHSITYPVHTCFIPVSYQFHTRFIRACLYWVHNTKYDVFHTPRFILWNKRCFIGPGARFGFFGRRHIYIFLKLCFFTFFPPLFFLFVFLLFFLFCFFFFFFSFFLFYVFFPLHLVWDHFTNNNHIIFLNRKSFINFFPIQFIKEFPC